MQRHPLPLLWLLVLLMLGGCAHAKTQNNTRTGANPNIWLPYQIAQNGVTTRWWVKGDTALYLNNDTGRIWKKSVKQSDNSHYIYLDPDGTGYYTQVFQDRGFGEFQIGTTHQLVDPVPGQ